MEQRGRIYKSSEGKLIVRKGDDFIMGDRIDLGSNDSIDNYEERSFTEEEIANFYKGIGDDDFMNNEL